jgi:hypothetical protein
LDLQAMSDEQNYTFFFYYIKQKIKLFGLNFSTYKYFSYFWGDGSALWSNALVLVQRYFFWLTVEFKFVVNSALSNFPLDDA